MDHPDPEDQIQETRAFIRACVKNPSKSKHTVSMMKKLRKTQKNQLGEMLEEKYEGCPLLHLFAENGNATMCQAFLEYGADPNLTDQAGYTALHCATRHEQLKCIDLLYNAGVDVNAENNEHKTAMQLAQDHQKTRAVNKLMSLGQSENERLGPLVQLIRNEINAHSEAIQRNRGIAKNIENEISEIQCQLDQKATREEMSTQMANLEERLVVQRQDDMAALHRQVSDLEVKQQTLELKLPMLEMSQNENNQTQNRRLLRLEKAVSPADVQISTCEEEQRYNQLKQNYPRLLEKVSGQEMRATLFAQDVISIEELDHIASAGNTQEQQEKLLIVLFRKEACCWVTAFLEILEERDESLYMEVTSTTLVKQRV